MTREVFHALMVDPNTPALLDRMIADNARVDAEEIERIRQRHQNDAIYLDAVRTWFRKTERR